MRKHILSLLLAAILLASSLAGCGNGDSTTTNDDSGTNTDTTATVDTTPAETETTREQIEDNLPDKDYGGQTFTLFTRVKYEDSFMPEELTGEGVNDALYQRNATVSDRFNVKMQYVSQVCEWGAESTKWNETLVNGVMAGDKAYDLVAGYASTIPEVVTKGILLDWNTVPYIDMSRPWWSEQVKDVFTINGKMFLTTGDYSLALWDNMFAFLFNKQVAEDHDVGDLYAMVREGKWTMDKLQELCSLCVVDLNGDGKYDAADKYGLVSNWSTAIDTFQTACDMQIVSKTDSGSLALTINSERAMTILEKVVKLYNESHGAYSYNEGGDMSTYNTMFSENRALFYPQYFEATTALRDMETDFGVLPYPKLDEAQKTYISTSRDNFDLFVLPVDVPDIEFSGLITEALSAESYRRVIPQYYDVVLKVKNSRDEESAEMIDLIRDTLSFDLGYLCSTSLNGVGHIFVGLVREGKTDLVSKYTSIEPKAQTKLDDMLAAYGIE